MHIALCHERFLFRFGADRVLILLGKLLKERGHTVTIIANRYDADIVNSFASAVIEAPCEGVPYLELNEFTRDWLKDNWGRLFAPNAAPDIAIVGGWPFIASIDFFREVCEAAVFVDFGVVPSSGYSEGMRITLDKLRALRREHLPQASIIVPLSQFLADTQSKTDSRGLVPVKPILLGANHMELSVWPAEPHADPSPLQASSKRMILCLGRWEPGCYKNSEAALEFMRELVRSRADVVLLVLEEPGKIDIPADLAPFIQPIGFPRDPELVDIMRKVDVNVSFSLWEGFNLPLAEAQWLGKPALVFHEGAHPEVVAHPWFLCKDVSEMARKAVDVLSGAGPDKAEFEKSLDVFRSYFRWERVVDDYVQVLQQVNRKQNQGRAPFDLFMDVSNAARDPANSGVVRVARRLGKALQENGYSPVFVLWEPNLKRYVLPTIAEHQVLSSYNGPQALGAAPLSPSSENRVFLDEVLSARRSENQWLLLPEVMMENSFRPARTFARERSLKIATIFYDSIPILRPDLCNEQIRNNHSHYMLGLAECDLAIPISKFSAQCLDDFWREARVQTACQIRTDVLPGEFGGSHRNTSLRNAPPQPVRILCVSTLEPRKNHRNLVEACLLMGRQHPELDWSLTLVGNRYRGAFEIAEWVEQISAKEPRIKWVGIIDDDTLNRLYDECSFTVYASSIEGFGLPIVESIWHGRPCICSDQGVMAELAAEGGCMTTDVNNPAALSDSIYLMATNAELWSSYSREAVSRTLKTWRDYVMELTSSLEQFAMTTSSKGISGRGSSATFWQTALFPDCLCDNWQMNDSERMALLGVLARQKPTCSIEVGTYFAGSLSLISQYSKLVFSIDIDETIPSRFWFPNVHFLTGYSKHILPHLLRELDEAEIPVEFILIDGDHSAQGVIDDVNCLLNYVPKHPLFVLLHDSFNPECRRGMLESKWEASPYCHWVELDFVPGRIIEHPGPSQGELWGGLAAAYFAPVTRIGELSINRSAERMFEMLKTP